LQVVWKEEFEGAGVSCGGWGNDEVEDGAEVVGGYEGVLSAAEGDVRQVLADGYHEGWGEVGGWEVAVYGA
jgi:hypothetical protein